MPFYATCNQNADSLEKKVSFEKGRFEGLKKCRYVGGKKTKTGKASFLLNGRRDDPITQFLVNRKIKECIFALLSQQL